MDASALLTAAAGAIVGAVLAFGAMLWRLRLQERRGVRAVTREILVNVTELTMASKLGYCPSGWFHYEVWERQATSSAHVLPWRAYVVTAWFYGALKKLEDMHRQFHTEGCTGILSEEARKALDGVAELVLQLKDVWKNPDLEKGLREIEERALAVPSTPRPLEQAE